jgi:hypothetical protein
MFLLIILRTEFTLREYPKPAMPWIQLPRNYVMEQLGISVGMYTDAVTVLRDETGLIEWEHRGGRAKAGIRLSPEGEAWARAQGLLPNKTNVSTQANAS